MFGSFLHGQDPFFAGAQLMHQMDSMMNSMMQDPFSMSIMPVHHQQQIMTHPQHQQQIMPHPQHQHQSHPAMMPFGGLMGFPMPDPFGVPSMMGQMMQSFSQGSFGAGAAPMFSSSSVMTMTTGPDGRPQVYQASTTTRTAPGGVKEVHRSVSDSRSGVRKMAIGRHLGDRGHVLEKEHNYRTGENEEREDLINIDEEEVQVFDDEWNRRARSHGMTGQRPRIEMPRPHYSHASGGGSHAGPLAITAGASSSHDDSHGRSRHSTHPRGAGSDRHARKRDAGHRSDRSRNETSM